MKSMINGYRDLEVWKLGMSICEAVYAVSKEFPADEKFGLTSQMRRAAVSISSNVAEGFARNHKSEYRQFVYIALGSSSELETQVELCNRLGFISKPEYSDLMEQLDHESRMLKSLANKLS